MWRIFWSLEQALAFARGATNSVLIALDKASGTTSGAKVFVVTTPAKAYEACLSNLPPHEMGGGMPERGEHQYELIHGDRPARLYYDGDFVVALNRGRDPEAAKHALHYYAQRAYAQLPSRPPGMRELRFDVETAHDPTLKFSYHGKAAASCGVVADREDQRAFWAHALSLALEDLESADAERKQRAQALRVATPGHPDGDWFWDSSVYSHNRFFRKLSASKRPKEGCRPRYLVPEGALDRRVPFEQWNAAHVMNVGSDHPFVLAIPDAWHAEAAVFWGPSRPRLSPVEDGPAARSAESRSDTFVWSDLVPTAKQRAILVAAAVEAYPAWDGHLDSARLQVQVAHACTTLSLLPRMLRIKSRNTFCPLKEANHDTEACILEVADDGTRSLRCLSRNHPGATDACFHVAADETQHSALAALLVEFWGPTAWLGVLHARYAHIKGLRDRNIVEVYRNDKDEEVVAFHSRHDLTELWHGMLVYRPPLASRGEASEQEQEQQRAKGHWRVDRNPFALWYTSKDRRRYESVVYEPSVRPGNRGATFNMFRGFGVAPLASNNPGSSVILDHLRAVLCGGVAQHLEYLLNCLAYMVQHPGRKLEVVLVFLGEKGTGKNALSTIMRTIFGTHALELVDARHLTGHFNAHLAHCNLIVLNEAVWGGDKQAEAILKSATTDSHMMIEAKYGTPALQENKWSFMVLTNSDFPVPITEDDRRFAVFRTTSDKRGDVAYFDRLYNAISDGVAVREFFHFLLHHSLPGATWRPAASIPRTAAWVDVMLRNSDQAALAWLVEKAREGSWSIPRANWPRMRDDLISSDHVMSCPKWIALQAAQSDVDRSRVTRTRPPFVNSITAFTQALKRYLTADLFSETFRHGANAEVMYRFAPMTRIRQHLATVVLKVPDYFGGGGAIGGGQGALTNGAHHDDGDAMDVDEMN